MSSNTTIIELVQELAHDDLVDAYEKLAQSYRELKINHDILNQKLHQEISQRKVYENSLNDIQSELDSINEVYAEKLSQIERKNEEYKERNQKLSMENLNLENKVDEMSSMIRALENECSELKVAVLEKKIKPRYSDTYSKSLELENSELRKTNNNLHEQILEFTERNEMQLRRIEELTENVDCIRDNFESKKAELDERNETIEQLQEKMHELSSELALLKNTSLIDDNNRKGNSLFAEVDDQRQKMKKILQSERNHYLEMKRAVNAREMEIRRLKRENLNIKSEIETCNQLLKRGEQVASSHTKIYITQLEADKQNLQRLLRESEEKLLDVLNEKKLHWVESVLTATTKESRNLQDKNYVLLREKTLLADNHSKILKDLSKARLDGIKLKVLLGRIVDEFNIKINESHYSDIGVEHEIFENLQLADYSTNDSIQSLNKFEEEEENVSIKDAGELNESTIILLGGRERLGNAIPKKEIPENIILKNTEEKENELKNPHVPFMIDIKQEPIEVKKSPLQEKSVQFSSNITTKVIDKTEEEFKASNEARKKPAIIVKRIVIPSRPRKVNNNN
ncbi:hypothetical protein PVAND_004450 [Polypedilum vanderplanki]|uniref:Uncharacterized protein n=1 Tax=Polypedilum vanderplanki TaxID=319348 RepID=A0A9J6BXL2_POLVA|nr:hypothetical protein PVAND_004450 [Polypedilum vanderplanki]